MADKGKSLVVLRKNWPGTFRRTVTIGKTSTQLEFSPGEPVEVDAKTAKALVKDIGQALSFCRVLENGKLDLIAPQPETEANEPEATD